MKISTAFSPSKSKLEKISYPSIVKDIICPHPNLKLNTKKREFEDCRVLWDIKN